MQGFKSIVGGKWWKVDFHLHTPGSYDYGHGDEKQKETTPEEFLKCCMSAELDCVVIADHNTLNWVPKLRAALEIMKANPDDNYRDITIFPGIELNVQGNIHLLGVFDPAADEDTLKAIPILAGYDKTLDTTTKAINEVIDIIIDNNGVAIPAHVDMPSGLFYEGMKPTIIRAALGTEKLLALEVLGDEVENATLKESKQRLSYVVGSDSHSTDTIGNKYTWVKMGTPNIEAMRLALFDNDDGVIRYNKIDSNPNDIHGKTYIKSLEISNGKYIGRKNTYEVQFSPWLNSVIGGRGSGKSSVLKFMRLILDREDELPESLRTEYSDFMKVPNNREDLGMLQKKNSEKPGTVVKMEICVDGVDHLLKWEDHMILELNTDTNDWEPAQALKERFPVRMFSQKQLFEMTGDTKMLFQILDSKWDYGAWKDELASLVSEYGNTSRELYNLKGKQNRLNHLKVQLNDVMKKIKVFETEKTRAVLKKREQLRLQHKAAEKAYDNYAGFIEWINEFEKYTQLKAPLIDESLDVDTAKAIKTWSNEISGVVSEIEKAVTNKNELFISLDEWIEALPLANQIKKNEIDFKEVINYLKGAGVDDVDLYADLITQKEQIEKEIAKLAEVSNSIRECNTQLEELKEKWRLLINKRYNCRNDVIQQWNQIGALRISLIPFGDISSNEKDFRNIIRREGTIFSKDILEYNDDGEVSNKGILYFMSKENDINTQINNLDEMKKKILSDTTAFGKRFADYLYKLFNDYPDSVAELELWIPKDALKLEININKKGKAAYRSIEAGSPGQRTSAVLSLILGISTMPIIIDQPEDDLDTRNITDIVVSSINDMKKNQQIIVVTHNPNIVVNTNSEQVIQLDFVGGQIVNSCSGALQSHDVRDAICEVMEGGKEALEKRYYRIFRALEK